MQIPAAVESHAGDGTPWNEWALTKDVSAGGVSLELRPEVIPGQILLLELPLPPQFCQQDANGPISSVFGVVRNVRQTADAPRVGVQFIGRTPPEGYERHPGALFLLSDDLPSPGPSGLLGRSDPWERRYSTRFRVLVNIVLRMLDGSGQVVSEELTVTEDVGRDGLRVKTSLGIQPGDILVVRDPATGFEASVGVCDSWVAEDGVRRLNLRFLGGQTGESLIGR